MSGIRRSVMSRWKGDDRRAASAERPSSAVSTSNPSISRIARRWSRISAVSSTTRMRRVMVGLPLPRMRNPSSGPGQFIIRDAGPGLRPPQQDAEARLAILDDPQDEVGTGGRRARAARKSARVETLRSAASVMTMPISTPARSAGPSGSTPVTTSPLTAGSSPWRSTRAGVGSPRRRPTAGNRVGLRGLGLVGGALRLAKEARSAGRGEGRRAGSRGLRAGLRGGRRTPGPRPRGGSRASGARPPGPTRWPPGAPRCRRPACPPTLSMTSPGRSPAVQAGPPSTTAEIGTAPAPGGGSRRLGASRPTRMPRNARRTRPN